MNMKRIVNKLSALGMGLALILFTFACSEEIADRTPSPLAPEDTQGIYFDVKQFVTEFELEPEAETKIEITLSRQKTEQQGSASIVVVQNDGNVFTVPSMVGFPAGDTTISIELTFPAAEIGVTYNATLRLEGDNVNEYVAGFTEIKIEVTRVKWEAIPTAIFTEGIVSTFFSVTYPTFCSSYVDAELATYSSGLQRLRIKNPYKLSEWGNIDQYSIADGYLYNEPADMLNKEVVMFIEIDGESANMRPLALGFDWGYGEFSTGSLNPYFSTNYPLGEVVRDNTGAIKYIKFDADALFISMANYNNAGMYLVENPTYIFFSVEDYLAAQ
jgi:hypothetical protein